MKELYWKIIFIIIFFIWFFIRASYAKNALKLKLKKQIKTKTEKFLVFLNFIGIIFLPLSIAFTPYLDFANLHIPEYFRFIFLIIYILNLALFIWCHKTLGKNLSILEIKKGPYKRIRHPIYTHFWLLVISQSIILNNYIVLIFGTLVWSFLYFTRIRKEEEMMINEFGSRYLRYMKKTGRLLPKLRL